VRFLIGALLLLMPLPAIAGGFFCVDTCTLDPVSGNSCSSLGMGCNPITHVCVVCQVDAHCAPGGTCVDNQCVGNVCQPLLDSGVDPDAGGLDGEPAETGGMDADVGGFDADGGDATIIDSGAPRDMGFVDATDPTMMRPGGRGPASMTDNEEDEDCACTQTRARGSFSALWLLFGLLPLYRAWTRGGTAPGVRLRIL
jgi:hypothetical protein